MNTKAKVLAAAIALTATTANASDSLQAAALIAVAADYCGLPAPDKVLMPLVINVANETGSDVQVAMKIVGAEYARIVAIMTRNNSRNAFCAEMRKLAYGK